MALLLFGCATTHEGKEVEWLKSRVTDLKRSLNETNFRLEDLNNKFILLHEKIEETRKTVKRLNDVPVAPPEGLSVVNLEEETYAGLPAARASEEKKNKSRKRAVSVATTGSKKTAAVKKEVKLARKVNVEEAEVLYNRGQDLFMAGDFVGAKAVFKEFVDSYPDHTLSDNALYWLGESYYSERDYKKAVLIFEDVVKRYPSENKAPDALLKTGYSYMELDEPEKARDAFSTLLSRYPDTEAARRGRKKYKELFG